MKKVILCATMLLIASPSWAQDVSVDEDIAILKQKVQQLEKLQSEVKELKQEIGTKRAANISTQNENQVKVSGGVSSGFFFANNPGEDASSNRESKFILTNALIDLSISPKDYPFSFDLGLGGPSAAPALGANVKDSDATPGLDIEYADLSLNPVPNLTLEAGLLCPNAGYEDTYSFNNKNITVGLIASQQPYNAYGARATYSINGFDVYAGYYRDRLDDEEYVVDGYSNANHSYEFGISGKVAGFDGTAYLYNVNRIKSLAGLTFERDLGNVYVAFDGDYWQWTDDAKKFQGYKDKSAYGLSLYVSPKLNKNIEIPVRLEYADQRKSHMYIDSNEDNIYAVTVTPTYHL
ncbi:MAG: outer membrane beta-barrel protein, partial [Nitrospiraceae bacterium]|nr:outer membrane beta-barrel protein [Nitrospiraceae bacterium]